MGATSLKRNLLFFLFVVVIRNALEAPSPGTQRTMKENKIELFFSCVPTKQQRHKNNNNKRYPCFNFQNIERKGRETRWE